MVALLRMSTIVTTITRRPAPDFNVRVRGGTPRLEVAGSNLSVRCVPPTSATAEPIGLTLARAGPWNGSNSGSGSNSTADSVAFAVWGLPPPDAPAVGAGGAWLCASGQTLAAGGGALREPYLSLRTATDVERLRVDSNGVRVDRLTAHAFTNLPHAFRGEAPGMAAALPPSAAALSDAYITLSNMVVQTAFSGSNYWAAASNPGLVNSYLSTSVLEAPTANALRAGYYNLSNLIASRLQSLNNALPGVLAALACNVIVIEGGSNAGGGGISLVTDTNLQSSDGETRLRFENAGHTTFAAPSVTSACNQLFVWADTGMALDVMRVDASSNDLWVRGGAALEAGTLRLGAVALRAAGSNLGVNLAPGAAPTAALHVNGTIYSTNQVLALSDERAKEHVRPLRRALARVRKIGGYTYAMREGAGAGQARQVGVLAQQVRRALPEAVAEAPDGRLSVAYGNLVALALQAIRELDARVARVSRVARTAATRTCRPKAGGHTPCHQWRGTSASASASSPPLFYKSLNQ